MPNSDPEVNRARLHQYYLEHKDAVKEAARKWAEENRDRRRQISRESRRKNYKGSDDANRKRSSEWAKNNPEKVAIRNRRWMDRHPEQVQAARREWNRNNQDKLWGYKQVRRLRERNACTERVVRSEVFSMSNGLCGICHLPVDPGRFHVDHIIPLSKGGSHCYANVQLAHPLCNQRKAARYVDFTPAE